MFRSLLVYINKSNKEKLNFCFKKITIKDSFILLVLIMTRRKEVLKLIISSKLRKHFIGFINK